MEPWQTLPSPLLSSLLFLSSFLFDFFLPCQAAPDVRSINTLSAVSSVCVCVYTYLTAQGYALLALSGISPITPWQEGKAGVLLRNRDVSWRSVCVTKWWACGSCDWSETLTLTLTFLFFSRLDAALLICFHGLPALADVLERWHVPELTLAFCERI